MNFKKIAIRTVAVVAAIFIVLVIIRMVHFYNLGKTNEQVAKIHATKLTLDDVMGKNLPPDPGEEADKTVAGVDVNENGIRDDVELAIFKAYPDSAKTRAVLLQYALALQMEFTQEGVNEKTVTEIITKQSRADSCISDTLVPRESAESTREYSDIQKINTFINFVKDKQINTEDRKKARQDFTKHLRSYGESESSVCDIDSSALSS